MLNGVKMRAARCNHRGHHCGQPLASHLEGHEPGKFALALMIKTLIDRCYESTSHCRIDLA